MTLDPVIEARVRAKREARLDRDLDALALLDEVERLRDALADEHAGRCADQLDLAAALAACAEQTARAERAEKALSIAATERQRVLSEIADAMHGPTIQPLAERVRGYVEECAHRNEIIGALTAWAHEYGAALKPPGADTYGEGKRDAKSEVATILRGEES